MFLCCWSRGKQREEFSKLLTAMSLKNLSVSTYLQLRMLLLLHLRTTQVSFYVVSGVKGERSAANEKYHCFIIVPGDLRGNTVKKNSIYLPGFAFPAQLPHPPRHMDIHMETEEKTLGHQSFLFSQSISKSVESLQLTQSPASP